MLNATSLVFISIYASALLASCYALLQEYACHTIYTDTSPKTCQLPLHFRLRLAAWLILLGALFVYLLFQYRHLVGAVLDLAAQAVMLMLVGAGLVVVGLNITGYVALVWESVDQ